MGLDLALLPFDSDLEHQSLSHTVLDCVRRGQLFEELLKLPSEQVPEHFTSFLSRDNKYTEGYHYGDTQKTLYGDPLTYVLVETLLPFKTHEGVTSHYKNKAIWAYLAQLPPGTKVVLYWC